MCAEPRDSATIEQLCGLHWPARVVHWTLFALKLSFKVVDFYLPQDLQTGIFFIANEIFSESNCMYRKVRNSDL